MSLLREHHSTNRSYETTYSALRLHVLRRLHLNTISFRHEIRGSMLVGDRDSLHPKTHDWYDCIVHATSSLHTQVSSEQEHKLYVHTTILETARLLYLSVKSFFAATGMQYDGAGNTKELVVSDTLFAGSI